MLCTRDVPGLAVADRRRLRAFHIQKIRRGHQPDGLPRVPVPWFERGGMEPADEEDRPVFVGRWNIGAVSLHRR